jgi:hypothetical protein
VKAHDAAHVAAPRTIPVPGAGTASTEDLMNRFVITTLVAPLLLAGAALARADDSAALIALDKQWGEARIKADMSAVGALLGDQLVSVSESGVRNRAEELADNAPITDVKAYEPTDFKVVFLNPDTAIMTHGVKGGDGHYSLHVWSRTGGSWKVVASSTTPAAKKP